MSETCPHCGYCPHCKRAAGPVTPRYPVYPAAPYWQWIPTQAPFYTNVCSNTASGPSTFSFNTAAVN